MPCHHTQEILKKRVLHIKNRSWNRQVQIRRIAKKEIGLQTPKSSPDENKLVLLQIVFKAEKQFTMERTHNHQNNQSCCAEVLVSKFAVCHGLESVMVLVFNSTSTAQDSALTHNVKTTQEWCKALFSSFITSTEWAPYSPDLSLIDFRVESILEASVSTLKGVPQKPLEYVITLKVHFITIHFWFS